MKSRYLSEHFPSAIEPHQAQAVERAESHASAIQFAIRWRSFSCCYSTVRLTVAECDKAPEVAVTVTM